MANLGAAETLPFIYLNPSSVQAGGEAGGARRGASPPGWQRPDSWASTPGGHGWCVPLKPLPNPAHTIAQSATQELVFLPENAGKHL